MISAERLSSDLRCEFGLQPKREWEEPIRRELEALGHDLHAALLDDGRRHALLHRLASRVTVNETHFFRHADQLERVIRHLVDLDARRAPSEKISVWSAGCASGEEPYSIAILLYRALGERMLRRCTIAGNDVSSDVIERAREAAYTAWSFRGTPSWVLSHFSRAGDGRLHLDRGTVRDAVAFEVAGCQERARRFPDRSVDVVLFRNVAIYLEPEAVTRLHTEFARVLAPDGLLAIGPSDPRPARSEFVPTDVPFVYARAGGAASILRSEPKAALAPPRVFVAPRRVSAPRPVAKKAPSRPEPPKSAATVPTTETSRRALSLGDAGRVEQALVLARTLVDAEPSSSVAHRILGQLLLEAGELNEAVGAFRRSLYFEPRAALARYFLGMCLWEQGDAAAALGQLRVLGRELAARPADELVDDGETRVGELAQAVRFLEGEWR